MEPVAIIGMGCRFPGANTPQAFWELLRQGGDAVREVPKDRWDLDQFYDPDPSAPGKMNTRWGGFLDRVDEFDAAFFRITPREAEQIDPQQRLLLQVAWEAIEDAGLPLKKIASSPTGVFVGIMNADYSAYSHQDLSLIDVHSGPGNGFSIVANRLSYVFDLRGPSLAVDTACASSLTAVHLACTSLQRGECNLALAGGVNVILSPWGSVYFSKAGLMAPDGRCKAFDAKANGIVRSEGAGVVVLKRLSDARADGDPIYAVIRGTAINHDGRTNGITAPNRWAQEAVIREAYRAAGLSAGQVQYVETHGTGTALGDPIEAAALGTVLAGDRPPENCCLIGSVKSNIGHLESAAGIAGLIKVILSLQHQQIPPSLHFNTPNPYIPFDKLPLVVVKELTPWPKAEGPLLAGVSGFGFGGANAHIVVEEFRTETRVRQTRPDRPYVLALSARSDAALRDFAQAYVRFLIGDGADLPLDDICYTASVRRTHHEHRLGLVGRTREELVTGLGSFLNGQADSAIATGRSAPGRKPKLVFVFPGQGSQWLGMGRQLLDKEPVFGEAMRHCEQEMQPHAGWRLIEELTGDQAASRLEEIDLIQPALFAIQISLAALWRAWGIEPHAVVGHSLGEVAAVHVAGALSLPDAAHVICARSRLMKRVSGQGAMAVVELPPDQAREALTGYAERVSIAVCNSPTSTVLSGDPVALQEVLNRVRQRDVFCRMVKVDVAAHSPQMDPLHGELVEELSGVRPRSASTPIYSTVTGAAIQGESLDATYWGRNLREPVLFSTAVQQLVNDGNSIFVEISPHPILLSAITSSNLQSSVGHSRYPITALPSLRRGQDEQVTLLEGLGALYTLGVPIDWNALYPGGQCVRLPSYPWQPERYWLNTPVTDAVIPAQAARGVVPSPLVASPPKPVAAEGETRRVAPMDEAIRQASDPQQREQLMREFILERLSHVFKLPAARLDAGQPIYSYGLDSLMALELKTDLERRLGVSVPLVKFFQDLDVDQLAAFALEQMMSGQAMAPAQELDRYRITPNPEARTEPFELTDVQRAYWIGRTDFLALGNTACHVYAEIEFDDFDLDRFSAAWQKLIDRHDMLRTIILPDGRQQVLQHVPAYQIPVLDLSGTDVEQVTAHLDAVREQLSHQILPADQWPLFELRASRLGPRRTRLHISLDALIADAWSLAIMDREVTHLYRHPEEPLPPLELTFRDYVMGSKAIEQSELYRRSWDYWQKRLPTLPPGPDLPLAKSPASITKPRFTRRSVSLTPEAWLRIKERARRAGVTSSGVLMAAFAQVLTTWSKSPRFTVNLTLFSRLPLHPQVNNVLGDFTSLTLLEVDNSIQDTFETRARRLQEQLWQDLDHRYVGGVRVQRELARRLGGTDKAAMPVVFTSTLVQEAWGGQGSLLLYEGESVYGVSQTPQVWLDHQVFERSDGTLILNWDAVEELFPEGMLGDMLQAYHCFLQRLADIPETWREAAPGLIPAEQLAVRAAVNATEAPVAAGLLHEPFVAQALRQPERPAVLTPTRTLSYGEVYRRANQVGRRLRALGAQPNRLVGVVMDKGWEQVVAVLGVLAAGAAYLPIDPSLPRARVEYLLAQGEVHVVLTQPWLDDQLAWPAGVERLVVGAAGWAGEDEGPLAAVQGPEDLAYVIFTSGSTGQPKGVMIDHRGALNTCVDVNQRFGVGPADRVLGLSSLWFDLSVYDLFGVLGAGGTLVLPAEAGWRDPAHWAEWLERGGVTVWDSVPALLELLVEYLEERGGRLPGSLRLVLLSGDWIPVQLPDRLRRLAAGELQVVSLGGATEASIWSILYPIGRVDPAWKSIPYGTPLANQRWAVWNAGGEPCPTWVAGQLYIGGLGVAQGYWRDEAKTAAHFVRHRQTGERWYATGDLGRYWPDGTIEFLGREDAQVKLRGYRIELGEIEATLEQHAGVRAAVVQVRGEPRGEKQLVGYIVPAGTAPPTGEELRRYLTSQLPAYMVPATFQFLERLPLTANGKVDRQALPAPETKPIEVGKNETGVLARIIPIIASVMNREVNRETNLLELGANSIDLIRLASLLEREFRFRPEMIEFFRLQTVGGIADYYEQHLGPSQMPVAAGSEKDSILASFQVLLDPEERDKFKKGQHGLRKLDGKATRIELSIPEPDDALKKQYAARCSHRRFVHQPVPLEQLGRLLSCLRPITLNGDLKYLYGSAGPTYSVQTCLYVKPGRVERAPAGVYYFNPMQNALVLLSETDRIDRSIHFFENQTIFDESAFSIFLVSQLAAIAPLYGAKSRDFALLEAGLMAQLLETTAPACQIGLCQIGNLLFDPIKELFSLDESHVHLHTLLGGRIGWEEGEL